MSKFQYANALEAGSLPLGSAPVQPGVFEKALVLSAFPAFLAGDGNCA